MIVWCIYALSRADLIFFKGFFEIGDKASIDEPLSANTIYVIQKYQTQSSNSLQRMEMHIRNSSSHSVILGNHLDQSPLWQKWLLWCKKRPNWQIAPLQMDNLFHKMRVWGVSESNVCKDTWKWPKKATIRQPAFARNITPFYALY